ncbi:hypothetical protein [Mycobacterium malmoense]|uniref:hypothetical protein n=1 Tax=Mycobacterium malmoense TaxID=1780 RepID=UPI0008F80CD6|nr:hypothetical protein [Mycobacterium malmoense]OIN79360.1 hypothetical protein BMG05_18420 [Mycobacterium malmoense]
MSDANSIQADISGVDTTGDPEMWRASALRHAGGPDAILGDPTKQAWYSTHNGIKYGASFDAFEQTVATADQIAWTFQFSDGIWRDLRFILHELMEDIIARRKAAGQPTTAFPNAKQPPA